MSTWADVRGWLDGMLGVPVNVAVPEERPEAFLVVDKTGGTYDPPFDRPQLTLYAWATSMAGAVALLEEACSLLDAHPAGVAWHCEPAQDAGVPLETFDGTHYRMQITYQFAAIC